MYMHSETPFWIFLDAWMKTSNQCLTEVKSQIKYQEFLAGGTENKTEHHYATAPWFITCSFTCFISKREEYQKKSPVRRSKKTELEEIQRRATKMSKFLDFSVNWDARSTLEKREMRGIRQKSVNCWLACGRWVGVSSSLYLPVQNLGCSQQNWMCIFAHGIIKLQAGSVFMGCCGY